MYKYISFSLNHETDSDLIRAIEEYKAQGGNISDLIRNLLREYFFGPQVDKADDKALYKIIQLEKELQELKKEREEQDKKIAELERTISLLKQSLEQQRAKAEEEKRKVDLAKRKKEVLRDLRIQKLNPVLLEFKRKPTPLIYEQVKSVIKEAVERYPDLLTEEELWEYAIEVAPRIRHYKEIEMRRRYV